MLDFKSPAKGPVQFLRGEKGERKDCPHLAVAGSGHLMQLLLVVDIHPLQLWQGPDLYFIPLVLAVYTALRCVALRCVALRCVALRCVALRCVALRCVALRCLSVLLRSNICLMECKSRCQFTAVTESGIMSLRLTFYS